MAWNGYRAGRSAGGGALNGYVAPKAKQEWAIGNAVSVGFVKNLLVVSKNGAFYALLQVGTGRWYAFQPHLGLFRCEGEAEARRAA
jgi:hypothetical protein